MKPGLKKKAVLKTKELDKSRNGILNILYMKQIYYHKLALEERPARAPLSPSIERIGTKWMQSLYSWEF